MVLEITEEGDLLDQGDNSILCTGLLESWPLKINKGWQEVNILVLAYLGDAVYELWVRKHLLEQGIAKVEEMHLMTVSYVQAATQAALLRHILEELDETEKEVVRRGRNAKGNHPRNVDVLTYRHATAFEALVGYWYLTGCKARMQEILSGIDSFLAKTKQGIDLKDQLED